MLNYLSFVLFLSFQVMIIFYNAIAHEVCPPKLNIANTPADDPQASPDDDNTTIEESSTDPHDETAEESDEIIGFSLPTDAVNEYDTDTAAWKETYHFTDHITYCPRLQIASGYLDREMYKGKFEGDIDIMKLREEEGRVWAGTRGVISWGGDYGVGVWRGYRVIVFRRWEIGLRLK